MYLLADVSMPDVGSSKMITFDLPANDIATERRLFWPPERFFEYSSRFSYKLTSLISLLTSSSSYCPSRPLKVPKSSKCYLTVRSSYRVSCWGQIPIFYLIFCKSVCPKTSMRPEEGSSIPVSIERVVVLPAPLCPNKTKMLSLYIFSDRLLTATNSPLLNYFLRFWMLIILF